MTKKILVFIVLISILASLGVYADGVDISAPSAVLIDANTGVILFQKDANKKMFPASTTKIMTAIIAIENGNMDDIYTADNFAVNSISADSSKIGLLDGEQMSCKNLIASLIVASANDAANVLAENMLGGLDGFVAKMNEKAAELGAENTHFTNAHGLHDENHYTTAADLAKISRYAMSLPYFREVVSLASYTLPPTNMNENQRTLTTTNQLLNRASAYYYSYATGIKTGHTSDAGYCLVSSAANGDKSFICVVLGAKAQEAETMSFVDTRTIYKWAFSSLKSQKLADKGEIIGSAPIKKAYADEVILESETAVTAVLPNDVTIENIETRQVIPDDITAPIDAGEVVGQMEYHYNGTVVAKTNLVAVSAYKKMPLSVVFKPLYRFFHWSGSYILLALVLIYFIFKCLRQRQIENVKKRRKKRRMQQRKAGH